MTAESSSINGLTAPAQIESLWMRYRPSAKVTRVALYALALIAAALGTAAIALSLTGVVSLSAMAALTLSVP